MFVQVELALLMYVFALSAKLAHARIIPFRLKLKKLFFFL